VITTFSEDNSLMAEIWDFYIQGFVDNEVPGLIIDLRANGGGSASLAYNFAGYFFDEEIPLYSGYYYNELTGQFETHANPAKIEPAPLQYESPIAVLVGPECISACEGFAYALSRQTARSSWGISVCRRIWR
jgi:C-terminal processing protease CtpA/Prc